MECSFGILALCILQVVSVTVSLVVRSLARRSVLVAHPVVGFGKLIAWGEKCLNAGRARVWKGGMMSVALIVGVYFFTFLFFKVIGEYSIILTALIQTLLIFCCLAGTTLIREVRMVFEAVDHSLDEGRKQVARIVGRDTSALSAQEVRTAALET